MTGDLASALDVIRGRGYRKGTAPGLRAGQLADYAADDIPRLLAAVEAALKLPAEWRHESEVLRDAAGKVWEDAPDAPGVRLKHAYAAGYAECAKALEAAITSALAGKEEIESRRSQQFNCSDPPEESCSDAGCPVHGDGDDADWGDEDIDQ